MRWAALALVAVVLTGLLGGCSDPQESYCTSVEDHQAELGDVLGGEGPDALLNALPIFRDLADEAPDDIRADWRTLITALERLRDALEAAGADPATYDRENPPPGVSQAERDAIDAAATELTSPQTVTAFEAVQQQAKDVCGTPLNT